jgi:hypothetical protein
MTKRLNCSQITRLLIVFCATFVFSFCLFEAAEANTSGPSDRQSQTKKVKTPMKSKKCGAGALNRSKCMIELIFEELSSSYSAASSGGGVSKIQALSTTSYMVSVSQEERIDQFTFEFDLSKPGVVTLIQKTESTKSP